MKIKRILALLLCVILFVGTGVGCGKKELKTYSNAHVLNDLDDYPIIKEEYEGEITLKIMSSCSSTIDSDWEKNKFFKRMNKLTGIDFNYDNVFLEGMYKQKKPLAFTSEETMPDIFFKAFFSSQDEITYGANKQIISLNKLIKEYAPNLQKILDENPIIRRCITTPDGNIYALPTVYLTSDEDTPVESIMRGFWWINQEWLKDVGEVDTLGNAVLPSTIEDLYRVLTKFKEEKCTDGNAPLAICGSQELFNLFPIFGIDLNQYYVQADENGVLVLGPETDNFYEALKWLRKFFVEGLINQDWNNFSSDKRYTNAQKDLYGMYFGASPLYVSGPKLLEHFITLDPLTSTDENGNPLVSEPFWSATYPVERGCFAITSQCQYPEVAIRWIDTLYDIESDYWKWAIVGDEGREWEYEDKTRTTWQSKFSTGEYAQRMKNVIVQPGDGMPYAVDEAFFDNEKTNNAVYVREQRNKQMAKGKVSYPMVYIGKSDLRSFTMLSTNLINYVTEFIAKSINSGIDKNSFNAFKSQLGEYDVDEYMAILQKAYNNFYGL